MRFKLILNVPMLLIQLDSFSSLLIDDIRKLIPASSNASCSLDPIPMWLVKSSWSCYFKKLKADSGRYRVYLEKDKQRTKEGQEG